MAYDNSNQIKASLNRKLSKNGKEYFSGSVILGGIKYWITEFENDDQMDQTQKYKTLFFKPADNHPEIS